MSPRGIAGPVALAILLGVAGPAAADTLYLLSSTGLLRALDPATGAVLHAAQIKPPGKVVSAGAGLGATAGATYALVGLADDCALDPTRTFFAGGSEYGCNYASDEECEQSFVVSWNGQPTSCALVSGEGCTACGYHCANTCAPPPPCLGSSHTQWAGFGVASCRQFDGDAAGCAAAYYSDESGTFTCYENAGQCLGCDAAAQVAGACTYGCQPASACADAARDIFVGTYNCWLLFDDTAACERAFQSNGASETMACVVGTDGYCTWCDANGEAEGYCTNSCAAPPPCAGDPARSAEPRCYVHDADADACAQAYTTGTDGEAVACFLNENDVCIACEHSEERAGRCIDACSPPVCSADPGRTTLLQPPADCHALDGDPTACAAAYFVGACGISSCHYDADASVCRACTVEDPERCENACGPFDGLEARRPALVTVDLATGAAAVVGSPGVPLGQPTGDATGTVHALGGGCIGEGIFRLDPSDLRPSLVAPFPAGTSGALALHPDGQLYRFGADGLSATDPLTGITTPIPVDAPVYLTPQAMTWAPACNAFLVADHFDGVWLLDPATGTIEKSVIYLGSECDEGDCSTGLVLDGTTVCPPLTFPTFTTTTTTTSTSSSTSSTTLPSELVTGRRLVLTDDPAKPRKRRLQIRSDDPSISLGGGEGSGDDPVLHGGTLRVRAASGAFDVTYPLDGAAWRYVRRKRGLKGYGWRGDGPLRQIVLRPGRLDVRGQGADLQQSLVTDPGAIRVVLQLGGRRWCLEFGGTFDARTPQKLRAHDAPAPLECVQP